MQSSPKPVRAQCLESIRNSQWAQRLTNADPGPFPQLSRLSAFSAKPFATSCCSASAPKISVASFAVMIRQSVSDNAGAAVASASGVGSLVGSDAWADGVDCAPPFALTAASSNRYEPLTSYVFRLWFKNPALS